MGGDGRDEKAVAMVIGDKGLESTVAPASINDGMCFGSYSQDGNKDGLQRRCTLQT